MAELHESIEHINNQLIAEFGRELIADNEPRFRVVWSDDQFEKRWTDRTKDGFPLLYPEVRELPKYQWAKGRYILERLVPVGPNSDLTTKVSYEPAWTFETDGGRYLPPRYDACQLIIEAIFSQINTAGLFKKYKDPDNSPEYRKKKIDEMQAVLFGNETSTGDSLAYKEGITNPAESKHFEEESTSETVSENLETKQ